MIFTFTIIFWFVSEIYCLFIMCYKQNIQSNCLIISFKPFPVFYSSRKLYTFPIILISNIPIFDILSGLFSMFWWFNATIIEYWKHLLSQFFGFIVALLFNTDSGDFMYDFHLFRLVFMNMMLFIDNFDFKKGYN